MSRSVIMDCSGYAAPRGQALQNKQKGCDGSSARSRRVLFTPEISLQVTDLVIP